MKGFHFYEEFACPAAKRRGQTSGTVFAAFTDDAGALERHIRGDAIRVEGVGAVFFRPNSPVAVTAADTGYLRERCKRISEERARMVHPALFAYLDAPVPA